MRAACACATRRPATSFDLRAENVVNATGVWADRLRPDELHDEAEVPRIAPSRGTHITVSVASCCRCATARSCRRGRGARSSRCRGSGSTLIGTTDNDYDDEDLDHIRPAAADIEYLLDATNGFFATEPDRRRSQRRLRRRAPADLDRRPEEVGRHLAQGGAVRDQQRA